MSFLTGRTDLSTRTSATVDEFVGGVDYTAGSSTTVTLTADPGTENDLTITFDGVTQHRTTWSVSSTTVTFDAAIPTGTLKVEATYGSTYAVGTVPDDSVATAKVADNAISLAKMAHGTANKSLGFDGSGVPAEISNGGFTLGTEVATTSGTAVTFTGIPTGTTMIVVMLEDVSFSSENGVVLTLGDAGGLETSGYVSTISKLAGTSAAISSTAGFDSNSSGAGDIFTIQYVLTLQNAGSFKWNMTVIGKYSTSQHVIGGGSKSLSAELTQVSISGGTFDAGSINILYQ